MNSIFVAHAGVLTCVNKKIRASYWGGLFEGGIEGTEDDFYEGRRRQVQEI